MSEVKLARIKPNPQFIKTISQIWTDEDELGSVLKQVEDDLAIAVQAYKDDEKIGDAILRFEQFDLVICAYIGKDSIEFVEKVKELARKNARKNVRFHSSHKGAGRMAEKAGFEIMETVYKVAV